MTHQLLNRKRRALRATKKKAVAIETAIGTVKRQLALVGRIKRMVGDHYGLTVEGMLRPTRKQPVADARHVAMYLAREMTGASFPVIAKAFGKKDHMSAMHAVEVVEGSGDLAKVAAEVRAKLGKGGAS